MKTLKISLVAIVVVAIGTGILFWTQHIKDPEKLKAPENQFTRKIEQEIEQIKAMPDNNFSKGYFNDVTFHINEFYKLNRFGSNQSENNQWKENLESNLYAAYTEKFIKQVKYVFSGTEWKPEDLRFIKAEKNALNGSKFLVAGSHVDKEFEIIQTAVDKYYEIVSFISSCQDFRYLGINLSDRFPINDVRSKIQRATSYRNSRLENKFVNNCTRLHNGINEIPQVLFKKHVLYLDNKINNWSGKYSSSFSSQREYSNLLYIPLKAEIEALDEDLYKVANFDSEYNRLLLKWRADNERAYNFKFP